MEPAPRTAFSGRQGGTAGDQGRQCENASGIVLGKKMGTKILNRILPAKGCLDQRDRTAKRRANLSCQWFNTPMLDAQWETFTA